MSGERPGEAADRGVDLLGHDQWMDAIDTACRAVLGPEWDGIESIYFIEQALDAAVPVIAEAVRAEERERIAQAARGFAALLTPDGGYYEGYADALNATAKRLARDSKS